MTDFIKDTDNVRKTILGISRRLSGLSNAAGLLGLKELSSELGECAYELGEVTRSLVTALDTKLHEDLNAARRDLASTLKTALSGLSVCRSKLDDEDPNTTTIT